MDKRKGLPDKVWREIRAKYEAGIKPSVLIRNYALNGSTFFKRRKTEQWLNPKTKTVNALKQAVKNPTPDAVNRALELVEKSPVKHVNTETALDTPSDPTATRTLALVSTLADTLKSLMRSPEATSEDTKWRDRTRGLLDLANTLERIQRIERMALGLDSGSLSIGSVVIVAPAKMQDEEWAIANRVAPEMGQ